VLDATPLVLSALMNQLEQFNLAQVCFPSQSSRLLTALMLPMAVLVAGTMMPGTT
jgi:hypothetical protein